MSVIICERTESAAPVEIFIDRNGGVTGLTVQVAVRDGDTTNSYLDWNDLTFKTTGWTTQYQTVPAIPGRAGGYKYVAGLDISSITNLPAGTDQLELEFDVSGAFSAIVRDTIQLVNVLKDIAEEANNQTEHDATQAAIAALNDLSIADVQTAMDNQGYTSARAGNLDNLDATVSSRSDFDETTDPVELLDSGGSAGTSAAELVADTATYLETGGPNPHGTGAWDATATVPPQTIRDAMLLAPTPGVPAAGSVDEHLDDILTDTNEMQGKLPTNNIMGSSDKADHDGEIGDILTDTNEIQGKLPANNIADETLQQAAHTQTQADIAALNDLSIADVQTALTNQGYTVVRAALLDNLDALISSRSVAGDAMTLTTAERNAIVDAVWDELVASHLNPGSTGEALNNAGGTGAVTPGAIADAVWDEDITTHTTADSTGKRVQEIRDRIG